MRQQVFASLAVSVLACSVCPAQNQLWITQFGTGERDGAEAAAPDGAGGVFIAGHTEGSLGGASAGATDVVLARYDSVGNQAWIRQFGTDDIDAAYALAPDGEGGVFIAGHTYGSLGGPNPTPGFSDVFLARFDDAGNQRWIRQFGTDSRERAFGLATDDAGGVFITGHTESSLSGLSAGHGDVFLARYNGAGDRVWIRQFGSRNWDEAFALAPDGTGGVFVSGATLGSLAGSNTGVWDAFLGRYDSAGSRTWIRQFGTSGVDRAYALAHDGVGGVFVGGGINGTHGGQSKSFGDAFIARYDNAGNQFWMTQFGTIEHEEVRALAPDGSGGVYVGGDTHGDLAAPNSGYIDAFLAHHDSAGDQTWIEQLGTSLLESVHALATDSSGGVYAGGETYGTLGAANAGKYDIFLARYEGELCYADCDQSTGVGILDVFDFLCFQDNFVNGTAYACNCDATTGNGICDVFDFLCFQNVFVGGCP